ncbi:hypothetical protein LXL04_038924 [Taraxacum kok-saghyz]
MIRIRRPESAEFRNHQQLCLISRVVLSAIIGFYLWSKSVRFVTTVLLTGKSKPSDRDFVECPDLDLQQLQHRTCFPDIMCFSLLSLYFNPHHFPLFRRRLLESEILYNVDTDERQTETSSKDGEGGLPCRNTVTGVPFPASFLFTEHNHDIPGLLLSIHELLTPAHQNPRRKREDDEMKRWRRSSPSSLCPSTHGPHEHRLPHS